jgi:geranylgeranyl reductase family protein
MTDTAIYDVIIVGGGPGGSTCATVLGKKGKKVLILEKEKFPRDKTCGDAISGKSMGVLRDLGLHTEVENSDHGVVTGLTFSSPKSEIVKIKFKNKDGGLDKSYTCRRMVYDNILFNNAKKHATAMEGMEATSLIVENGKVVGVKAKGKDAVEQEFRAKLVVGADGSSSITCKHVGDHDIDPNHTCIAYRAYYTGITGIDDTIEIHFEKSIMPGYFWIFPLENGIANVGIGMVMKDMKDKNLNLQKSMEDIIAKNPLFKERFANAKLVSPIKAWRLPFGSKRRKGCADGIMLIGDALGLVDPFSGEGIGNAMLSGKLAAEAADAAIAANDTSQAFLSRNYEEKLWEIVGGELSNSYNMQRAGKYEWLLNFVISKAAKSEKAREAISGTLSNEEAKKGYASPLFYLKLLLS